MVEYTAMSSIPAPAQMTSDTVYVGGVPLSMTSDGLRALFTETGVVRSAVLATDRLTGYSRGFGFVVMASAEAAAAAVKKLHRFELEGRRIIVQPAALPPGT